MWKGEDRTGWLEVQVSRGPRRASARLASRLPVLRQRDEEAGALAERGFGANRSPYSLDALCDDGEPQSGPLVSQFLVEGGVRPHEPAEDRREAVARDAQPVVAHRDACDPRVVTRRRFDLD